LTRERTSVSAIMIIAVALRIYGVFRFPFEQDELYTIDEATNLFHTHLLPGIQARPFFFLLEHPFLAIGPSTAPYIRLLPLMFGVAGVWVTWRLARDAAGPVTGLVALILVAISPWHLYASGFGRYYSLLYLLAAIVYWRLPKAYDLNQPREYLFVLVPLFLGTWTHPSFAFPVIGVALAVSIFQRDGTTHFRWPSRTAWLWLWGPFLTVSACVAVTIRLLYHNTDVSNGSDRGLPATVRLVPAMIDWMTLITAAAAVAGVILLLRSSQPSRRRFGSMAAFGAVFTVLALFALSFRTSIYADYGISALPLLIVAAAYPSGLLASSTDPIAAVAGSAVLTWILVIGVLPPMVSHLSDGTRFDYREAFSQINRTAPDLAVLTWPIAIQHEYGPGLRSHELPSTVTGLDSALSQYHDLWAVTSVKRYGMVGDDTGEMERWFWQNCREQGQFERPRLDYRIFRVDLWRCTVRE
jgi:hypothetical protein